MARKCRKLIYVQVSQKIRDSEDGLASEGCQKGSYWAFNESSFSWTWGRGQTRMMPTVKWRKRVSWWGWQRLQQEPRQPAESLSLGDLQQSAGQGSEQPDLTVKLAMHSSGCTEDLQRSLLACSTQQDIILMTDLKGGQQLEQQAQHFIVFC